MRIFALLGAAVLAAAPIHAQSVDPGGWYLGGGLGITNVFANEDDSFYGSSDRGSSDTGFLINGGYRFNRYFAVEAGYLDGGTPSFSSDAVLLSDPAGVFNTNVEQELTAFKAVAVGILPFLNIWELYLEGGAAFWDATSSQVLTPVIGGTPILRIVDDDGVDFLLGLGVGVSITPALHARLGYVAFRTDDKLLALDSKREARFDSFNLELHWRFGPDR
ncbi:MAG: outer membrane beta-barrel protein [Gammaproteobacteria bacterium]|nr:outer membrane beta-barrel protein [Gammaproteobacteria bacterium]